MNYRHIYHAGSFADVIKHCLLIILLNSLKKKDTPFCYIDSHAGAGCYDLKSDEAIKTKEAEQGIYRVINYDGEPLKCFADYLPIIGALQPANEVRYYPGSPIFVSKILRDKDSMILNEYHLETYNQLKKFLFKKNKVSIHRRDAYEFLPAILPPKESRGLVLIDPPFESKTESQAIQDTLEKSLKKWANGIYFLWYPITAGAHWNLQKMIKVLAIKNYLIAELTIDSKLNKKGLIGCGHLIINPPWQIEESLNQLFKQCWNIFNNNEGSWHVKKFTE